MIIKRILNRKYLIIIFLLLSTMLQSQANEPVFIKKSSWTQITTNLFDSTFIKIRTSKIKGDTLINGKIYMKVYSNNNYAFALRETDDNRVYAYYSDEYPPGEYLRYDFD